MSQWPGTDSIAILFMVNRRPFMATSLSSAPFDARRRRRRPNPWPLGLTVAAMALANLALWLGIYAITHGHFALDPRFFAGL